MKIFVDTSAFYALADIADRNHHRATAYYDTLTAVSLVTTDHILIECWFLIGSRLGRHAAIQFWDGLRTGIVDIVPVGRPDLDHARETMERFPDQPFSLADATSFAVMERERITRAFSFDAHFRVYRYGENASRSFEVHP